MSEPTRDPAADGEPRARLDRDDVEVPGDLDAPDLVSPVGEEMPIQSHDQVEGEASEHLAAHRAAGERR